MLWNPTQGKWRPADVKQTSLVNKQNVIDLTTRNVAIDLRRRVAALAAGQTLNVYVHSQGAAIMSSASRHLTPAERARISLTNFGGAAWSLPSGFHSVENVINRWDPIAMLVGKGIQFWDGDNRYFAFLHDVAHPMAGYLAEWEYAQSHAAWLRSPGGRKRAAQAEAAWKAEQRQRTLANWEKR